MSTHPKCEKCGDSNGWNRIDLFWESRTSEPRIHFVCNDCFDTVQALFNHEQLTNFKDPSYL